MKKFTLLLFVAGLVAGPAYWAFAKFFTGSRAVLVNLDRIGASPVSPWRTADFTLAAEMAPAGLILHAGGSLAASPEMSRPPSDRYAATLFRDGTTASPLVFTLGVKNLADPVPTFKEHLLFFKVIQAGQYRLEVTPAAAPEIRIDRMQLEVRQHLHEPDSRVVTAGMVVMVLGILGFFL